MKYEFGNIVLPSRMLHDPHMQIVINFINLN